MISVSIAVSLQDRAHHVGDVANRQYHDQSLSVLRQINQHVGNPAWVSLDEGDQVEVVYDVVRLYGSDPWTSDTICSIIDGACVFPQSRVVHPNTETHGRDHKGCRRTILRPAPP